MHILTDSGKECGDKNRNFVFLSFCCCVTKQLDSSISGCSFKSTNMTDEYKYLDRSPTIRAAGYTKKDPPNAMRDCFTDIVEADKIEAVKRYLGIDDKKPKFEYKPPPGENKRYCGLYTDMRKILAPPLKSPFQSLAGEIRESTYASYWEKPVAKRRDHVPLLPGGTDVYTTTYGKSTKSDITVGDLVNPDRPYEELIMEMEADRLLYKYSPYRFSPGEQITRNYEEGGRYSPCLTFGKPNPWTGNGYFVARALTTANTATVRPASQREAEFFERAKPRLGKPLQPNNYLETILPEDHTFGLNIPRDMYGMAELLQRYAPSLAKEEQRNYLAHINSLRNTLKKRFPPFPFQECFDAFKAKDPEQKGWLPKEEVEKVCEKFRVDVDKKMLADLMQAINIISPDGQVNYTKFMEIINCQHHFPILPKICDLPQDHLHYETSYQAAQKDRMEIDNSVMPTAGLPTARTDKAIPIASSRCDIESLGDQTEVASLISPSIFTQYGVSHRDFFLPRRKQQIRDIFCSIGVNLPDDVFEELYKEACDMDQTGAVCVETFRNVLDKHAAKQLQHNQESVSV